MLDFLFTFRNKNTKQHLLRLVEELRRLLSIHSLALQNSPDRPIQPLDSCLDKFQSKELMDLIFTFEQKSLEFPFFSRYLPRATKSKASRGDLLFADLFAGCGGLSFGLERAGFTLAFANELDVDIAETHYFNHSLPVNRYWVGNVDDLIESENSILASDDLFLVVGGPPCQGFSTANRQRLLDDPRNHLYKSYLKFLKITRPKWFLIENVRGMASKESEIHEDIARLLGSDYRCSSALLNAKDFGIPQNRERFFLVGTRTNREPEEVFKNLSRRRLDPFSLWEAIKDLPSLEPKRIKNDNSIENTDYGFTMTFRDCTNTAFRDFINHETQVSYLLNHKNRYNNDRDIEIFSRLPQGGDSTHPSIADIMPYGRRSNIFKDKYYRLREDLPCKTITAHMKFDCNMYIHPRQSRGLSPREAARIQTFPDDFFFRGTQNNWFKQIGNAVPVKLAELIGESLIEVAT